MSSENSMEEDKDVLKAELVGDPNEIVRSISRFYDDEELSDVILKLGSQRFRAHKFVLLLMSDVFKTMWSKRWENKDITEIELNECEQCVPVFPMFLHFLYHGQVLVKTTTALPLLMLADKYNVQPLKVCCEAYIRKQVEGGNVVGAIRWLPYLQLCGHQDLEEACIGVIIIEMEYIINCDDFLLLNFELLTHLLKRNDLVVPCEYILFLAVVKWIEAKTNEDAMEKYIDTLIPMIRFSMMFPEHLMQIEQSSFYLAYRSKISAYLSLAHRYRSLIPDVVDEVFSGSLYRPRNYTNSRWCHFISVDADNVSFFNKSYNLHLVSDPLPSASKPQDPVWQVMVVRSDKRDGLGGNSSKSSSEGNLWHSRPPLVFPSSPSASGYSLALQMALRPLKPINSNVAVEVSLFRLKNDVICRHLDSSTFAPVESNSRKTLLLNSKMRKSQFCFQASSQEKVFQPTPMHFSFPTNQTKKDSEVILRHDFLRSELDSPPEVPCVQFGPGFGHSVRPIHCIKLAIIIKPHFKSLPDFPASPSESELSAQEDALPLLG